MCYSVYEMVHIKDISDKHKCFLILIFRTLLNNLFYLLPRGPLDDQVQLAERAVKGMKTAQKVTFIHF